MAADVTAPACLADLIDAHGHRVTAELTRSGLVAVLTRTVDGELGTWVRGKGFSSGHPALDRENARELGNALLAFAEGEGL